MLLMISVPLKIFSVMQRFFLFGLQWITRIKTEYLDVTSFFDDLRENVNGFMERTRDPTSTLLKFLEC